MADAEKSEAAAAAQSPPPKSTEAVVLATQSPPPKSTEAPAAAQSPPPQSPVSPKSPAIAEQAEPGPPIDAGILPASHWEPVEEEEALYDDDSGLGDLASSTASLSSSILQYRTVLGRTYASEIGKSEGWTPNDEQHTESMDIHHHACTLLLGGKLFLAPLNGDTISKVVDIGTGTGIWAIDFGDEFPNAEVIGTDISPIQPTWIPPNVKFEIDDANLSWTWKDDTFDFVHVRGMIGTIIDWPAFYREAFRCCKPGGYMEHHDEAAEWHSANGEISEASAMGQWGKVFSEGGKKFGRTFRVIQDDVQIKGMEEAGFVDIVVKDYMCPIGDWPRDPKQKEIGMFSKLVLDTDLAGFVNFVWSSVMGWSNEEIQVYLANLRREMRDKTIHTIYPHRVVYGRKPE